MARARAAAGRWSTTSTSTWAQTTRTKRWLPGPLRLPLALAAERAWSAPPRRRLAGVVTANEDLAARFAAAGARAVSVTNSPWSDAFPEPAPLPGRPGRPLRRRARARCAASR